MARYRVIRDCTFKNGYWSAGQVVEFPPEDKVPEHFEPADSVQEPEPVETGPATFSEINKKSEEAEKPSTGFMAKKTKPSKK